MIKLCWMKSAENHTFSYFFNMTDKKIFCVDLQEYEKKQIKFTPTIAAVIIGPLASCISTLFRGQSVFLDKIIIGLFVLILMFGIVGICCLYNNSQKNQDAYILSNSNGEHKSKQQIKLLFNAGKNYRAGIVLFICLCLIFILCAIQILKTEQSAIGIILFYIGAFGETIWLNILSPIKLIKIKLFLHNME